MHISSLRFKTAHLMPVARLAAGLGLMAGLAVAAVSLGEAASVTATNGLTVTESAADAAVVGQPLEYTITVTNSSSADATFVTLGARVPLGARLTGLPNPNLCGRTNAGGRTGFGCAFGTLAAGASATIIYSVVPTAPSLLDSPAVAQGFVNGTFVTVQADLQTPANASVATAPPPAPAPTGNAPDVQLSGAASSGRVAVGTTFQYIYQVKNGGNALAQGVTLSDTLPANMTFVGVGASAGTCTHDTVTVTCDLGDLPVGAQDRVTLAVSASTTGLVTNEATVADTNGDSKPSNNLLDITVQVQ